MTLYHHTYQATPAVLSLFAWKQYINSRGESPRITPKRLGLEERHFGFEGQLTYKGIQHVRESVENDQQVGELYYDFLGVRMVSRLLDWQSREENEILSRIL